MKNLILSAATFLTISFNAVAATPEPVVNEKARETFISIFKEANDVNWSESGTDVSFTVNKVKAVAKFDNRGNLVQTVRYYKEDKLSAVVLSEIRSAFPGKEIFGVVEVNNKYGINYRIVLRDSKHYIHINANSAGDTEVVDRHKRADL